MLFTFPAHRACAKAGLRLRALLRSSTICAVSACCGVAAAQSAPGPTVKDVVEFTHLDAPKHGDEDQLRDQVSPDGSRAFILTRKANTRTDRNRYEFLLLDVRPDSLAKGQATPPMSLLALEPAHDNNGGVHAVADARWANARTIVFCAALTGDRRQAYKLDVTTRRLTQMTFSPHGVAMFDVSADLKRLVYVAPHPNPPMAPGGRSVVVGNKSFWSVKHGQEDFLAQQRQYRYFTAEAASRGAARALGEPFALNDPANAVVSVSPDGRWALLPRRVPERQLDWGQQYPLVAAATARSGPSLAMDPLSYFSRPTGYVPGRYVAVRLVDGKEQVVLDAPSDHLGGLRQDRIWQDGGRSVLIAGTHLPVGSGVQPEHAAASHIVEYWPETGRWTVVARLNGRLKTLHVADAGQPKSDFVAIDEGGRRVFHRRSDGRWEEGGSVDSAQGTATVLRLWKLRVKEALNTPADVFAEGPSGQSVRLTALNPQVSEAWGTMRTYAWKDMKGRAWEGGLLMPAGFDPQRRYGLVIQTYGYSPKRFFLDGPNYADGYSSGFGGRAYLRDGLLVLQLPLRPVGERLPDERAQTAAFIDCVRSAIDALAADGFVDKERVGILGFSMTGERVLNLVTFSDLPIRAATLLDGDANTLFSMTVTYAAADSTQLRKEKLNGGGAYGPSLETWVRNDPALHTDCVKAALRIETYGPWVLNNWDIYALLRRQYKAAEMVVIPDGTHALQAPSHRMISLQGNVDWYRFWLNGEVRTEPFLWAESDETLTDQYRRWHQMADLKRKDDTKPRCSSNAQGL